MYPFLKKILFCLPPERAHQIALNALKINDFLGNSRFLACNIKKPREVMGLTFSNPIALAAGLEKIATPLDQASDDYLFSMRKLAPFASYMTINISSPNTPGLRDLQTSAYLSRLLTALKREQENLQITLKKYIPLVVKISPELAEF